MKIIKGGTDKVTISPRDTNVYVASSTKNQVTVTPQDTNVVVSGLSDIDFVDDRLLRHAIHVQDIPSDEWIILHNLNKPFPSTVVMAEINGETKQIEGEFFHIDYDRIGVRFNLAIAGVAYSS